jgi:ankyrin repeat protein
MTTSLPPHPSLENLKKQAKALLKSWQGGHSETLARVRAKHPRYAGATEEQLRSRPRLADCQLLLAREAGFPSWRHLKAAVESANRERADEFVALACLCYEDPHYDHRMFHARAHEMLRNDPLLAETNIWTAAAAGNAAAVSRLLEENPELVNRPGPFGWPPLICACYSRVNPVDPAHSTFEAARILLDRGANPNTFTIREYYEPHRFTALTGLFGGGDTGMANQPPHPRWRELAELLLERGADPADATAIGITQDKEGLTYQKLEVLLRHGLKPDAVTTHKKAGGTITLLGLALALAACGSDTATVGLLLAHNARTDELFDGKTPWQHAIARGDREIARLLEEAGAPIAEISEVEQFVSLCLAGDERGARAMVEHSPGLLETAPKDMVQRAVGTRRKEAVRLVLDLGFDPNWVEDNAAIHHTGILAEHEEILQMLLAAGASLALRDPHYDGTAIEWADFFDTPALRERLLNDGAICLFDAVDYDRPDRVPDILARDPEALERPFAKCLTREPKAEDWQTPLVRAVDRGKTAVVRVLLACGANIAARHPDGRSLQQLASDKGVPEIAELVAAASGAVPQRS